MNASVEDVLSVLEPEQRKLGHLNRKLGHLIAKLFTAGDVNRDGLWTYDELCAFQRQVGDDQMTKEQFRGLCVEVGDPPADGAAPALSCKGLATLYKWQDEPEHEVRNHLKQLS